MLKRHEQFLLSFHLSHLHSSLHTRFQQLRQVWQKGMFKREHLFCCLQEVRATPFNGSSWGLGNACLSLRHDRCSINLFQEEDGTEKWAKGEKEEKGKKEKERGGEVRKMRQWRRLPQTQGVKNWTHYLSPPALFLLTSLFLSVVLSFSVIWNLKAQGQIQLFPFSCSPYVSSHWVILPLHTFFSNIFSPVWLLSLQWMDSPSSFLPILWSSCL